MHLIKKDDLDKYKRTQLKVCRLIINHYYLSYKEMLSMNR